MKQEKASKVWPRECTGHSKQSQIYIWMSQMVNTEIKFIIFFGAKDGKALYSQLKQDWELTEAQIMNSLLQN